MPCAEGRAPPRGGRAAGARGRRRFTARVATIGTMDGLRVDYADGFGLIRGSNTTPVLVLRFEGHTPEALHRIEETFMAGCAAAVKPDAQVAGGAPKARGAPHGDDLARAAYSTLLRRRRRCIWRACAGAAGANPATAAPGRTAGLLRPGAPTGGRCGLCRLAGETRAAAPLVDALRGLPGCAAAHAWHRHRPRSRRARLLRAKATARPGCPTTRRARCAFPRASAALGVLMETEVWPNLALEAARAGVPLVWPMRACRNAAAPGAPARSSLAGARWRACWRRPRPTPAHPRDGRAPRHGGRQPEIRHAPDAALVALGRAWRAALAGRWC